MFGDARIPIWICEQMHHRFSDPDLRRNEESLFRSLGLHLDTPRLISLQRRAGVGECGEQAGGPLRAGGHGDQLRLGALAPHHPHGHPRAQ